MILDEKELVKLCKLGCSFLNLKDIVVRDIDCKIKDVLLVYASVLYCSMECEVSLRSTITVQKDVIILEPKGIVKYGFIQLDLMKVLDEVIQKYDFISMQNQKIYIQNPYIQSIQLQEEKIELSLK